MLHLPSQLGCICNAVASAVKLGPVNSGRPLYSAPVVSYVFVADGGTPGEPSTTHRVVKQSQIFVVALQEEDERR